MFGIFFAYLGAFFLTLGYVMHVLEHPTGMVLVIIGYMHTAYGPYNIISQEGFQQGDPIASIGFCLVLHDVLIQLKSLFKCGYLDDISEDDHWLIVLEDLKVLMVESRKLGLTVNPSKYEVFIKSSGNHEEILRSFQGLCPGIQEFLPDEATLLGAAIGDKSLANTLAKQQDALDLLTDRVQDVPRHQAFFLVKHCFAVPKLLHLFRTSTTFHFPEAILKMDRALRTAMERIINIQITDSRWCQFTLPVKLGGFGISPLPLIAPSAFLASSTATQDLVAALYGNDIESNQPLAEALDKWQSLAPHAMPPHSSLQKHWTSEAFRSTLESLIQNSPTDHDKARFQGCLSKGAGDWIGAIPSNHLGLCLSDEHFRIACGLRIGAPVSSTQLCLCGTMLDIHGNHALSCSKIVSRFARHSACNSLVNEAFRSARIPATMEPIGLVRSDGRRPDGASLVPWFRGKCIAWDFTCVHRLCASNISSATNAGPVIADAAENRKRNRYHDIEVTHIFEPVAYETLGGIGTTSWQFLKELSRRIAIYSRDTKEFQYLRQRIGIAIQRGNASCILEALSR